MKPLHRKCLNKNVYPKLILHSTCVHITVTQTLKILQAAEKFKAPQPAPVIPEAKAATIEEEESEEEEVCEGTLICLTLY